MFNQDSKLLKGKYLFNSKLLEILKGSCLIKDGTNTQILVKETKKTKLDLPRAGQTGPSAPAGCAFFIFAFFLKKFTEIYFWI